MMKSLNDNKEKLTEMSYTWEFLLLSTLTQTKYRVIIVIIIFFIIPFKIKNKKYKLIYII